MLRGARPLALALALFGCSFDARGVGPSGGGESDAAIDRMPDSSGCSDIHATIAVGGSKVTSDQTAALQVVAGDTVALSIVDLCTPSGAPSYFWEVTPASNLSATFSSPSSAQTLVWSASPGDYHIELVLTDPPSGLSRKIGPIFAFAAVGPHQIPLSTMAHARALTAGGSAVWVATDNMQLYRTPLVPPLSGERAWMRVPAGGVPNNLGAAFYDLDPAGDRVWLGATDDQDSVFALHTSGPAVDKIDIKDAFPNGGLRVTSRRFSRAPGGPMHVATSHGVVACSNGPACTLPLQADVGPYGIAEGGGQIWAGGLELLDFDGMGNVAARDVIGDSMMDDRIRALAIVPSPAPSIWLATEGLGLGRFIPSMPPLSGTLAEHLTSGPSPLPSNRLSDLAYDAIGNELWIATLDQGFARLKLDSQGSSGSPDGTGAPLVWYSVHPDLQMVYSILIDRSTGVRRVFLGSAGGVWVLEAPNAMP